MDIESVFREQPNLKMTSVIQSRIFSNVKELRMGVLNLVTINGPGRSEEINNCMDKRHTDWYTGNEQNKVKK
jgi:hypothetical protein